MKLVGSLLVRCEHPGCGEAVQLQQLRSHLESGCQVSGAPSPSKMSIGQALSRPLDAPPTSAERKLATSVVKRLMHASPTPVVSLSTAGQVRYPSLLTSFSLL